ncbi:uncharacterized protein LOC121159475 [Ochotona curzoniae]|uniref:uncharacterized protein LOC121159475 n=1 Tax=Ochotona curzoniae TaxID=130825 RepID=UPI001B347EE0|nr:uncharacterized protein LOC121159475 [Ochotona curzoniae]
MATKEPLKDAAEGSAYRVNNHLDHKFRPQPVSDIIASAEILARNRLNYEVTSKIHEKFVDDLRYGESPRALSSERPQPGDLIEISRLTYSHWAVYVGDGYVVHLPGPDLFASISGSKDNSNKLLKSLVKRELLEHVVKNDKYWVNNNLDNKYRPRPIEEIVRLSESKVGVTRFYLYLVSNCEEFATEMRYGKGRSQKLSEKPERGDIIEIFHPSYVDWAIYVGNDEVIHLTPCSGEPPSGGITNFFTNQRVKAMATKEPLKYMVEGSAYRVNNHLDHKHRPKPVSDIIASAEKLCRNRENYEVLNKKFDKFVDDLRYGENPRALSSERPQPGDLIEISRLTYSHWAVYVGDGYVVHLPGPAPERVSSSEPRSSSSANSFRESNGIVKRETLEVLVKGDKYWVNNYLDNKYQPYPIELIVQLAVAKVGETRYYHQQLFNSEHFVTELRYGLCNSQQLSEKPERGDIIEIFHPSYVDWAIYVGNDEVIHLTPCSVEFSFTGVLNLLTYAWGKAKATKEPLKHEAEGPLYRVNNHLDHKYRTQSVNEIIASAKRLACDKEDYEFCSKTSEKFVNDLRYGKHPRLLSSENPQPGDLIEISRLDNTHWVVYVGDGYVVHLSGSGSSDAKSVRDSKGTVKHELLEDVVKRDKYSVNNYLDNKYRPRPVQEIIQLAKAKVGETRYYHLLLSNCEHFATELRYGRTQIQQSEIADSKKQEGVKRIGARLFKVTTA